MVSWWPGDDHTNDIVGVNVGTLSGDATYAAGLVGQAFSFDASLNTAVVVPATPSLDTPNAITIDAWVKPSSFPNAFPAIVRRGQTALPSNPQFNLSVTDGGEAHCNIDTNVDVTAGVVHLNQWTHIACTYDRIAVRLYVNGEEVASAPFTGQIAPSNQPLGIGAQLGFTERNFDGLIDEVEIFDRALTAEEISSIYDAGSAGKIKPEPPAP